MIRYNRLFEVKVFQEFYGQFGLRDLELLVTPEMGRGLKSLHLIYKQTPEGFIVLYNEEKKFLLEGLKKEEVFRFGISTTNRHFFNFSYLPARSPHAKHFLGNLDNTSAHIGEHAKPEKHLQVHPEAFLSETTVQTSCSPASKLMAILGQSTLQITKDDKTYFEGELTDLDTASSIFSSQFGAYEVTIDGTQSTLHFVPDQLEKAFAVVDITLDGNNFEQIAGTSYYLQIGSREIAWNYFFISKQEKALESITVLSGKKELAYEIPKKVKLANGEEALKLKAQEELPLKRNGQERMVAEIEVPPGGEHDVSIKKKIDLPKPDITRIKAMKDGDKEIYFSDMYIYL